jgi:hypothetical protein
MSLASIQFSRAFRTTEPDSDRSMVVHAANASFSGGAEQREVPAAAS